MGIKTYRNKDVLTAARERIANTFDNVERVYVAFSGGKDSTVLLHLVMDEAIKRNRKVAVMYIDFEAQYSHTIKHVERIFQMYADHIEPHWICIPTKLRNAVTTFEPQWLTWDPTKKAMWIRPKPASYRDESCYPFAYPGMEFEEFIVLFARWYGEGRPTAGFIGIRAQESLHRYCAVATWEKRDLTLNGWRWTTKILDRVYNVYPIYDWLVEDIWRYHAQFPDKPHNEIYDLMQKAGVPLSQQRLCQPYGDDQRKGLWLYHLLEPETWFKLIARVNGANFGALYINETGNVMGYNKITKPDHHSWKSFCNMLLRTLPPPIRAHYVKRFQKFIYSWNRRGYPEIPDEAPPELEAQQWAPSWRRMCKVLLRNDYWCKGLGQTQPKSDAYLRYKTLMKEKKQSANNIDAAVENQRMALEPQLFLGLDEAA